MNNIVQKQNFDYNIISTSFHEAAHTIVGLINYIYIVDVSVAKETGGDGETNFNVYKNNEEIKDPELYKLLLYTDLLQIYAGLVGEKLYYKDICGSPKLPMHLKSGSYLDVAEAAEIIRKNNLAAPGNATRLFKKQIQADIEKLLIEHWYAVKIIAHALYKKKKLQSEEIKLLLTRKIEQKNYWKDKFKKIKFIHSDNPPSEEVVKKIILDNVVFNIFNII